MAFSYQKIPSFLPKYKYFTVFIPWSFQGILVTIIRKKYGTYPPKSRVIEKMFDTAFKEKIFQRQ
jgi:hypothetical protein